MLVFYQLIRSHQPEKSRSGATTLRRGTGLTRTIFLIPSGEIPFSKQLSIGIALSKSVFREHRRVMTSPERANEVIVGARHIGLRSGRSVNPQSEIKSRTLSRSEVGTGVLIREMLWQETHE